MTFFHGLSAFPITPTDTTGKVNTLELNAILDRLVEAEVNSVGLLGSTGGYAYLNKEERRIAIETAAERLNGSVPLIASVGSIRTDEAKRLALDAKSAGADGLLMAPVSYTPLTQEEVYQHYLTVTSETDLPLCIYNNPGTTHFRFETKLLERLAQIPNIVAVKMPLPADGDYATELKKLRENTPDDFVIGYSGDWGCTSAMLSGADGWYSVVGGLFPAETMILAEVSKSGDHQKTAEIEKHFQPLWSLFQEYGSLRVVYVAANMLSLTQAAPHLPILPLPGSEHTRLRTAIEELEKLSTF